MPKKTKKQQQKELKGLGLLESFGIFIATFVSFAILKKIYPYQSNGLDVFVLFFILGLLCSVVPRITGIMPLSRFSLGRGKVYKLQKEPEAFIREILFFFGLSLFFGLIAYLTAR